MTQTATIVFGIILVASSIGFNVTRYPIVWQMASPGDLSPEPRSSKQSQASSVESRVPAESPKLAMEQPAIAVSTPPREPIKPVPEVTDKIPAPQTTQDRQPVAVGEAVATANDELRRPIDQKPLVPVPVTVSSSGAKVESFDPSVRRLPSVEQAVPVRYASQSSDTAYPIYPSTGIQ